MTTSQTVKKKINKIKKLFIKVGLSEPIMFFLRDTVTILSMILQISKTYIDHWKLNNNCFTL